MKTIVSMICKLKYIDRDGDRIENMSFDKYMENPIVTTLEMEDPKILGRTKKIYVEDNKVMAEIELDDGKEYLSDKEVYIFRPMGRIKNIEKKDGVKVIDDFKLQGIFACSAMSDVYWKKEKPQTAKFLVDRRRGGQND